MTAGIVRFVTPYHERVAQDGPNQVFVSHLEEMIRCHDCDLLHFQVDRDTPGKPGESESRLVDDFEAAYALAIAWLPEALEYFGRRVADDDDDEHNSAWRFDNAHEAVFWLLETP
jgi:hypothetical protein